MLAAWATDIHLNFLEPEGIRAYVARIEDAGVEALLLGGDIAEGHDLGSYLAYLEEGLSCPVYFVLGNHDYYGSDVESVHREMAGLGSDRLVWLGGEGVVPLTPSTALVGNGGWGDAQHGDFLNSPVIMSDFLLILDLQRSFEPRDLLAGTWDRSGLQAKLRELGNQCAADLRPHLEEAAAGFERVVVLTHVPPFREACWYDGAISNDDWLPFMSCKAMGDLLLEVAASHPDREFLAYCGHTHGEGRAQPAPNLSVFTQGARYGAPDFRVIDL